MMRITNSPVQKYATYSKGCMFLFCDESASDITLCKYNDAPSFLRENPYIIHGYRPVLSMYQCFKSAFLWTNETLNIWSHFVGFLFCFVTMAQHWLFMPDEIRLVDRVILCIGLICFQTCLLCSTFYHVFKCHSAESYRRWLNVDFFGISIGFVGCVLPAFHLAFYCFKTWYNFYMFLLAFVCIVFLLWHSCASPPSSSSSHFLSKAEDVEDLLPFVALDYGNDTAELHDNTKCLVGPLIFYVGLAIGGMLPALHWVHLSGGFNSDASQVFLPRIGVLYLILFVAFVFYLTKFPECVLPGQFDFVGSSHQCWHLLIVIAFLWWYHTGYQLLLYLVRNTCMTSDL